MIIIPSTQRSKRQETWSHLPNSLRTSTVVLVPEKEVPIYRLRLPQEAVIGCPVHGIGHTRQWALNWCAQQGTDKVIMMDDDLKFAVRRVDDPTKFLPATPADVKAMVAAVYDLLDTYTHASIATRQGANRKPQPRLFNERMLRVLAYNVPKALAVGVDYGRLEVMEDFDVTLTLMRAGHACALVNDYVQDQLGSNRKGGCSTYRDFGMQERSAYKLAELHAPFVRVVDKKTPAWGNFGGGVRKDVIIQWKKAFESSQE